ncbi:MAG: nickel pincer cofactor biosynthesis protein LarC [Cyanobacteria bacterium P01_F01_bin.150]
MTKIAYLDCPTGIAGDMCLGAIVDAGMPIDYLIDQLACLGISDEYQLWTEAVHRNGQRATKVHVALTKLVPSSLNSSSTSASSAQKMQTQSSLEHEHMHGHPHPNHAADAFIDSGQQEHSHHKEIRRLPDIERIIQAAKLSVRVKNWSLAIFRQLAKAEGAVHGMASEQVHFHEVGATDAIADIVGTCIGLDWLDIDQLYCSPLPTGGGTVWASHGRLPVPAPAVLQLFQMGQVPIYSNGINRELVTPTGAAIATTLATSFGSTPAMTLSSIGLGAGGRELVIPNILRLWIGESAEDTLSKGAPSSALTTSYSQSPIANDKSLGSSQPLSYGTQTISILETQLDDLNPQIVGYLFDQLLAVGALDVFTQAVGMKKSRPGILLTVLCLPDITEVCEAIIYRETTTLGIRRRQQERSLLHREFHSVSTAYGNVTVKLAFDQPHGHLLNIKPEYEDCACLAQKHHINVSTIHDAAISAAMNMVRGQ